MRTGARSDHDADGTGPRRRRGPAWRRAPRLPRDDLDNVASGAHSRSRPSDGVARSRAATRSLPSSTCAALLTGHLPGAGEDTRAYWANTLPDPYTLSTYTVGGGFYYAPPFAQAFWPLTFLPFPVVAAAWAALLLAALWLLVGAWALPGPPLRPDRPGHLLGERQPAAGRGGRLGAPVALAMGLPALYEGDAGRGAGLVRGSPRVAAARDGRARHRAGSRSPRCSSRPPSGGTGSTPSPRTQPLRPASALARSGCGSRWRRGRRVGRNHRPDMDDPGRDGHRLPAPLGRQPGRPGGGAGHRRRGAGPVSPLPGRAGAAPPALPPRRLRR